MKKRKIEYIETALCALGIFQIYNCIGGLIIQPKLAGKEFWISNLICSVIVFVLAIFLDFLTDKIKRKSSKNKEYDYSFNSAKIIRLVPGKSLILYLDERDLSKDELRQLNPIKGFRTKYVVLKSESAVVSFTYHEFNKRKTCKITTKDNTTYYIKSTRPFLGNLPDKGTNVQSPR